MLIPKPIGQWLTANLPSGVTRWLQTFYMPYHQWWVWKQHRRLVQNLVPQPPGLVQAGPFRGMKYADPTLRGVSLSKYVGAYESELHPVVENIIQRKYTTVINVGCAEGYYTVGIATRLPEAKVYAFDTDPGCQGACRHLARLNGVAERLQIRGACTPTELDPLIQGKTLVMSDCEGYEYVLLDPKIAPRLKVADILVELHDFASPGIRAVIESRFAATHEIQIIPTQERDPGAYPLLASLSDGEKRFVLDEQRGGKKMEWAFLTARNHI